MKKVLATVAAFGLVAGIAGTAAAYDLTTTGKYVVEGYWLNNTDGSGAGLSSATASDAYWMHSFYVLPTMKVNDSVTVKADIRLFKESKFGADDTTTLGTYPSGTSNDTQDLELHQVYMEYMSPIGKTRVGRTPAGAWEGSFLNSADKGNRIMWWPSFMPKPFEMVLFAQKINEDDDLSVTTDQDKDQYEIGFTYNTEPMRLALAYDYTRDGNAGTYTLSGRRGVGEPTMKGEDHLLKAFGLMKFSNFTFETELAHVFGDQYADVNWDAFGAYFDLTGKFGDLKAGAMMFYASGDDNANNNENEALLARTSGTGNDFMPLYILTGDHMGILNGDTVSGGTMNVAAQNAGVIAYGLHADYQVSPQLSLHAAVAYAEADEKRSAADDSMGVEYNVGASYKLLDNLIYEAHFGFLDTDDFFKSGTTEVEEISILSHHLTMNF